jgi:hypothetical protein
MPEKQISDAKCLTIYLYPHHINLKSDIVLGQVVVGVQPTLPVEDISFLFGIYMAGDKVNDHLLHSDGNISHYFIDKEYKSCVDTDED